MAQETNQSQAPLLCTTGCGFYGNPRKNGMCSVCYKDFLQRQNGNMRVSIPDSSPADSGIGAAVVAHCPSSSAATVATGVPAPALHTDTDSGQSSSVSSDSGEECTSGAEARRKTEDLPAPPSMQGSNVSHRLIGSEAGAVVASVQQDQLSAAGSSAARLSSRLAESPCRAQLARKCKRKVDAPAQSLAGKQAKLSEDSSQAAVESEEKPKAKRNRCFTCHKKIGLTGFDCRCGNVFCGSHRYSDMHECTFDYKADAVEKIRKENPVVVGEKIQKI